MEHPRHHLRRRRTELLVSPFLGNATEMNENNDAMEQSHNFGWTAKVNATAAEALTPPPLPSFTTANVFQSSSSFTRTEVPPEEDEMTASPSGGDAVPFDPALALTPPIFSSQTMEASSSPNTTTSFGVQNESVNNEALEPPSDLSIMAIATEPEDAAPPNPTSSTTFTVNATEPSINNVAQPTPSSVSMATTEQMPRPTPTFTLPTPSLTPPTMPPVPQQRIASPPPFDIRTEAPCRDTLSCLTIAQVIVLAALLVSLCCCLRCLASCMLRGSGNSGKQQRGVYRRIITDEYDADAFYDGLDGEDDDIFFDNDHHSNAIELNDMDRVGDGLALEEVNG